MKHAWFCAGLECLCGAVSVALWLWTGHSAFLFLSGCAAGCAIVISALAWEHLRIEANGRLERIES